MQHPCNPNLLLKNECILGPQSPKYLINLISTHDSSKNHVFLQLGWGVLVKPLGFFTVSCTYVLSSSAPPYHHLRFRIASRGGNCPLVIKSLTNKKWAWSDWDGNCPPVVKSLVKKMSLVRLGRKLSTCSKNV